MLFGIVAAGRQQPSEHLLLQRLPAIEVLLRCLGDGFDRIDADEGDHLLGEIRHIERDPKGDGSLATMGDGTVQRLTGTNDVDDGQVEWRILTQEELDAQRQAIVDHLLLRLLGGRPRDHFRVGTTLQRRQQLFGSGLLQRVDQVAIDVGLPPTGIHP